MSETQINQIASDVHLISSPFRWLAALVETALFLVLFPVVVAAATVYAFFHGGPIVDPDTWFLFKVLVCVLTPFATTIIYGIFAKGTVGSVIMKEFVVFVLCFVVVGGLIKHQIITFKMDTEAPSFRRAPIYDHVVVDGKVKLTCSGLNALRYDILRNGGSTTVVDSKLVGCIN